MKTILVPVDLSGASARVCAAARDLAKAIDGEILLLHVVPPPPVLMNDYYAFDTGYMAEAMVGLKENALKKLRTLSRRLGKGCLVRFDQVSGEPASRILARATGAKASYIVMGSHGHGAVFDLIVGSTTHGVLRKARCPVLVVPIAG
jgi:nucleotide-binding universal stress UspA family protein